MSREVNFAVSCADTRLGFHVRVVGSCSQLGSWSPQEGIPLHTSATDFPVWRSFALTNVSKDETIEYKYVICDHDGKAFLWEARPNRSMCLSQAESNLVIPRSGAITVMEDFNKTGDSDETRFRGDAKSSRLSLASNTSHTDVHLTRVSSMRRQESEQKPNGEDASDMFAPTIRERAYSKSLAEDSQALRAFSSMSRLAVPLDGDVDASSTPEVTVPAAASAAAAAAAADGPSTDTGAEGPEGSNEKALVREESCSNLFLGPEELDELPKDSSEFEDKYSLVGDGPLGEGTFGLVWRCVLKDGSVAETPEDQNKERAAKIVRKARLQPRDMNYLLGEDGEVRTHLTMKHPHIVRLFEFFDEALTVTLVLEYCRGGDLFDAIVRTSKVTGRGFTEKAAAVVAYHVLSALAYVHSHSVVHRDIKCENILLAYLGVPVEQNVFKLCDFGFAAHDHGEGLGDRLGSPDTVAPEVVQGRRYSTPADLWSTGVLIYMMLSATPPFYARNDGEVLRKVRTGTYGLSGPLWDSISAPPKDIVRSLMTVESSSRLTATQALKSEWLQPVPAAA